MRNQPILPAGPGSLGKITAFVLQQCGLIPSRFSSAVPSGSPRQPLKIATASYPQAEVLDPLLNQDGRAIASQLRQQHLLHVLVIQTDDHLVV